MRLSQAQHECVFGGIQRLEGFAEAAEDFFVLLFVFFREDDQDRRGESRASGCLSGCVVDLRRSSGRGRRCGGWLRVGVVRALGFVPFVLGFQIKRSDAPVDRRRSLLA